MNDVRDFATLKATHEAAQQRVRELEAGTSAELRAARAEATAASIAFYAAQRREYARQIVERLIGHTIVAVKPGYHRDAPIKAEDAELLAPSVSIVLSNGVEISANGDDACLQVSAATGAALESPVRRHGS